MAESHKARALHVFAEVEDGELHVVLLRAFVFFLFASSMFYPLAPLPFAFQAAAYANPITWQVDVLRYLTIGTGDPVTIAIESAAFLAFTAVTFAIAGHALRNQE